MTEAVVCDAVDGGLIAGAVIGAIACSALILAAMYYVFSVKGIKPGDISFFKHETNDIDVVCFVWSHFTLCERKLLNMPVNTFFC